MQTTTKFQQNIKTKIPNLFHKNQFNRTTTKLDKHLEHEHFQQITETVNKIQNL